LKIRTPAVTNVFLLLFSLLPPFLYAKTFFIDLPYRLKSGHLTPVDVSSVCPVRIHFLQTSAFPPDFGFFRNPASLFTEGTYFQLLFDGTSLRPCCICPMIRSAPPSLVDLSTGRKNFHGIFSPKSLTLPFCSAFPARVPALPPRCFSPVYYGEGCPRRTRTA